jgi:predicted O-methyltransferase YrrM
VNKVNKVVWRLKSFLGFYLSVKFSGKNYNDFIKKMLDSMLDKQIRPANQHQIEQVRNQLRGTPELIELENYGAGSYLNPVMEMSVKDIAENALSKPWQCRILYRLAKETGSKTIFELGSSLGISTSYLASLNHGTKVYTFEGSNLLSQYANVVFSSLNLSNIEMIEGNFDLTIPPTLEKISAVDFSFIDGNHTYESTIRYFNWILKKSTDRSVIVMDDIYWSPEMNKAWKEVMAHPMIKASIDFYKFGVLFLNPEASGHFKVFNKNVIDF